MTNEQAIKELQESHDIMRNHDIDESESYLMQALNMAIKALQEQADNIPELHYPQVDGITPTVVAQADGEKTCGNCRNEDTYHCAECENKSDYEQAQADGEYILKKDVMGCIGQTSLHWELARKLRKLPSVAIPSAEPNTGHWIIIDDCEKFIAKCSECGRIEDSRMISKYPYCHCGAKMIETQESEDKKKPSWLGKNCKDCGNEKCKKLGTLPKGYDCALWQAESEDKE